MRYPASEKLEIIRTVEASHLPTRQTLRMLGIPCSTYYDWYARWSDGGVDGLADRFGDADWLEGAFSAGDLMMVHALQRLKPAGLLDEYPNLAAYVARGEARPAFKRAFEDQRAFNTRERGVTS